MSRRVVAVAGAVGIVGVVLLIAGGLGGSSSVKLAALVHPQRVAPELVAADSGQELVLLAPDGSPLGTLAPHGSLLSVDAPAWSPDGRRIAFTADTRARVSNAVLLPPTDVYVTDSGGNLTRVTDGRNALDPHWSPDGRWIAFTKITLVDGQRSGSIWIIHPDGSGGRQITSAIANRADVAGPYNPRSGLIAFARCSIIPPRAGGLEPDACSVWTMQPDGSSQRRLASQSEQPAWSPDGRALVFASARDHAGKISVGEDNFTWIRQLYVMNADGSDQRRLLTTHTSDQAPNWAPGGRVLAYQTSTGRPDETVIAITNADGSCNRATVQPGDTAAWRPGGTAPQISC